MITNFRSWFKFQANKFQVNSNLFHLFSGKSLFSSACWIIPSDSLSLDLSSFVIRMTEHEGRNVLKYDWGNNINNLSFLLLATFIHEPGQKYRREVMFKEMFVWRGKGILAKFIFWSVKNLESGKPVRKMLRKRVAFKETVGTWVALKSSSTLGFSYGYIPQLKTCSIEGSYSNLRQSISLTNCQTKTSLKQTWELTSTKEIVWNFVKCLKLYFILKLRLLHLLLIFNN